MSVADWLRQTVKLPQYVNNFLDYGYDGIDQLIGVINRDKLIEIGIDKIDHREKILFHAVRLKRDSKLMAKSSDNNKMKTKKKKYEKLLKLNQFYAMNRRLYRQKYPNLCRKNINKKMQEAYKALTPTEYKDCLGQYFEFLMTKDKNKDKPLKLKTASRGTKRKRIKQEIDYDSDDSIIILPNPPKRVKLEQGVIGMTGSKSNIKQINDCDAGSEDHDIIKRENKVDNVKEEEKATVVGCVKKEREECIDDDLNTNPWL